MTERKKKTGDVVAWAVVDRDGEDSFEVGLIHSREMARIVYEDANQNGRWPPYRIAKVVLAK